MDIDALIAHHQVVVDSAGNTTAVLVDLSTWQQIVAALAVLADPEALESLEDYALTQAMDEAQDSPALTHAEALAFLAAD
jgi:PHD/YefM family antitoxin component YafN of YafNO toxin-antitoxin module